MSRLTLRCYCCGNALTFDKIALVSMGQDVDRVFVMDKKHVGRVASATYEVVKRAPDDKPYRANPKF